MIAIVGPTAVGKSALALALAEHLGDVELVSADAMQVYRGLDIGTAKPSAAEQAAVRHHLIDVADPWEDYSLARFVDDGRRVIEDITTRGRTPVLVGGTGLYVRGLVDDLEVPGRFPEVRAQLEADPDTAALHARLSALDPLAASRMEPTNRRRVLRALEVTIGADRPFSSFGPGLHAYPPVPTRQFGLTMPLDELDARIAARVHAMVDAGLVAEVAALASDPRGLSRTARQALGYREVLAHLEGGTPLPDAIGEIVTRTRRFARRQLRWFRRDPRVSWLDARVAPEGLVRSVAL